MTEFIKAKAIRIHRTESKKRSDKSSRNLHRIPLKFLAEPQTVHLRGSTRICNQKKEYLLGRCKVNNYQSSRVAGRHVNPKWSEWENTGEQKVGSSRNPEGPWLKYKANQG